MDLNILRVWAWRLALIISFGVILLSIWQGITFLFIVIRGIMAFVLIYGVSEASLYLFEKAGENEQDSVGGLLDIEVGQQEDLNAQLNDNDQGSIGSGYDRSGSPSGKREGAVSGQVNPDLANGLDEEQQAEIVRRMGWEKAE